VKLLRYGSLNLPKLISILITSTCMLPHLRRAERMSALIARHNFLQLTYLKLHALLRPPTHRVAQVVMTIAARVQVARVQADTLSMFNIAMLNRVFTGWAIPRKGGSSRRSVSNRPFANVL
jgi:hypothetical protein